jgi:hypothetical protein
MLQNYTVKCKNTSSTLLFADDQIIIKENEDQLQRVLHKLNEVKCIILRYLHKKSKIMAFKGKFPVRSKINIDNCPLEQVRHFDYLGCGVTYDQDKDVNNKLHKFQNICGTIRRNLKTKTRKFTQLKCYKTMAVPVLMYGSEAWTIKKNDISRIQSAEMKFLRSVK